MGSGLVSALFSSSWASAMAASATGLPPSASLARSSSLMTASSSSLVLGFPLIKLSRGTNTFSRPSMDSSAKSPWSACTLPATPIAWRTSSPMLTSMLTSPPSNVSRSFCLSSKGDCGSMETSSSATSLSLFGPFIAPNILNWAPPIAPSTPASNILLSSSSDHSNARPLAYFSAAIIKNS